MNLYIVIRLHLEKIDPKNQKRAFIETLKNILDKCKKLFKPNGELSSKITVLMCVTTFETYGSSSVLDDDSLFNKIRSCIIIVL